MFNSFIDTHYSPASMDKLLSLIYYLSILASSVSGQSASERRALFQFKKSVPDPNGFLKTWSAASFNHCTWPGVSCNSNLRVSAIKIIGGNISASSSCSSLHSIGSSKKCTDCEIRGRLSAVIRKFKEIRVLSLPYNQLVGDIPVEVWGLSSLEVLDLEGNLFGGDFSRYNFTCLKKLRVLNLGFNRIFGTFPASLSECKRLRVLNMAGNRLVGAVPGYVHGFWRLRVVSLSFNRLVGDVPSRLGYGCGELEHLDLSGNSLTGEIPRGLGNCRCLRTLLLSSNALRGVIPLELGRLQRLEVLDVSRNLLGGPVPESLGNCTNLLALILSSRHNACPRKSYLDGVVLDEYNSFEGSIPDEIATLPKLKIIWAPGANLRGELPSNWGSCKSLTVLNLAQNFLTGNLSGLLAGCKNLHYLNLSSNRLTGTLVDNLHVHCYTTFDISENMLSGPIPDFSTNAYNLTLSTVSVPVRLMYQQVHDKAELPYNRGTHNRLSVAVIASIVCASTTGAVLVAFLALFCYAKRRRLDSRIDVSASPYAEKVTVFNDIGVPLTYEIIVEATENFSARNCIGSGGFGSTYQAEVAPGNTVAVKRLTAERHQGAVHFRAEVATLGRIQHPNLITLIGYYVNDAEMCLIYNYLPGGNLDRFIRERDRRTFDWRTLHKIALHVASALAYLHDECSPCILHRDIKPSNILLDNDNNAYLSDFGLSKILTAAQTDANTCCIAGTYGYIAPEYALTGCMSDKADVYSYGVVLLELMSDKRALDPSFHSQEDGFNIVSWACMLLDQDRAEDVFAACVRDSGPLDNLVQMLHLAILCTVESLDARPTMKQVVSRLQQIQPHAE